MAHSSAAIHLNVTRERRTFLCCSVNASAEYRIFICHTRFAHKRLDIETVPDLREFVAASARFRGGLDTVSMGRYYVRSREYRTKNLYGEGRSAS
jgi:hypothetical protein